MKKAVISFIFGLLTLILSTFFITPIFNKIYVALNNLEPGPDTETLLLDLLVFVQWPLYFFGGIAIGFYLSTKYLTKQVDAENHTA